MRNKKQNRFVYWFPRIFGLVFACFLMLFSFDVFDGSSGFWMSILAFIIHSIPSIVLFIIIAISWRYELVGAISFILLSVIFVIFTVFRTNDIFEILISSLVIGLPAFLVGMLFLIGYRLKH